MSLFKISHGIPDEIKKLQRCFLWGGANNNRGMHFIRWDIVWHEKKNEGLGLVDLETKNRSLLTKWIWRYGNEREHIWRKIVTAKNDYDPHALLPKATVSRNCSKVWKYIISPLISTDKFFLQVKANLGVTIKESQEYIFRNPNLVSIVSKSKLVKGITLWEAPLLGWVKFNVDGASTVGDDWWVVFSHWIDVAVMAVRMFGGVYWPQDNAINNSGRELRSDMRLSFKQGFIAVFGPNMQIIFPSWLLRKVMVH
ncbi:Uncharacterized protein TCM_044492 [Theobroma cacao]|uniref:Uncharacterized protein n=1 Tax=Theobroma cacao TaxID=3641 RepID=A0A061FQ06_THECC|nr:Uncharacterized protein TCM_044492 [Theobroma cacao]